MRILKSKQRNEWVNQLSSRACERSLQARMMRSSLSERNWNRVGKCHPRQMKTKSCRPIQMTSEFPLLMYFNLPLPAPSGRLERHRAPTRNAHVPATMASRESTVEILFPHTFQFSFDTLISLLVLVLLFPFVNKNAFYSNVELVQRYFVLDGEDVSQKNNYKSFWTCDERICGLWMNTWINKSVMWSLVRWITSKKKSN